MYVCMYGWMDGWTYGCMGCMDVWMYGCMDVWIYACMHIFIFAINMHIHIAMYILYICMYIIVYMYHIYSVIIRLGCDHRSKALRSSSHFLKNILKQATGRNSLIMVDLYGFKYIDFNKTHINHHLSI